MLRLYIRPISLTGDIWPFYDKVSRALLRLTPYDYRIEDS